MTHLLAFMAGFCCCVVAFLFVMLSEDEYGRPT